jgi:CcmD family protein
MENLGYLAAAYSIIFAAIFLYVVFLWRRQSRLYTEISSLESKLKELRTELSREEPPSGRLSGR